MAQREAGIRERVSRALMVSAAVYALAIGVWAVQTRQLSEASPTGTGAKTTITFEEHQAPRLLGTQGTYEYASQGVTFGDDSGNTNATAALTKEGAQCNGGVVYTGEQLATSGSNRLHPYPGVSSPLVITFTNNRVSNDVSFQLLGVGDSKNTVEFFDHTGKVIEKKDFVNTGSGVGCDKKQLVSLSADNIAKIRITQPQNANGDDGLGIDDLSFAALTAPVDTTPGTFSISPSTGPAPLTITAVYTAPGATAPTPTTATITFDELQNVPAAYAESAVQVKDQYANSHGVRFSSRVQKTTGHYDTSSPADHVVAQSFGQCTTGNAISSYPFVRQPDPVSASPIRMSFDEPVTVATVKVYASSVPVYLKAFDVAGAEVASQTAQGGCKTASLTAQSGKQISAVEIFMKATEYQLGQGFAVDEVSITRVGTVAPATEELVWDFGDGTEIDDGSAVETHTYTQAGIYTVNLMVENKDIGQKTVTVTTDETPTPTETVAATLVTSKPDYDRGEKVEFTLKNTGNVALELKNGAPFKISQGATVKFSPVATQALEAIAAGQSKTWSWDQKGDDGQQVADGTYAVTVDFSANGQAYSRSAAFTVVDATVPILKVNGAFSVTPTSGVIPLSVTLTCTGDTIRDIVADWGDGTVTSGVTCPTTLSHTYAQVGTYTITLRQGTTTLGTQQVIALASSVDGKGAPPTRLASSGGNLIVLLLIATVVAGLFSYLIIRRPFHGGTTPSA